MEKNQRAARSLAFWSKGGAGNHHVAPPGQDAPRFSFTDLSAEQLRIYARELQEHYQEERRLRQKLEEWNSQLQQVLAEMTAMSKVMQERLAQSFSIAYAHREVLQQLEQVQAAASAIMEDVPAHLRPGLQRLHAGIGAAVDRLRASWEVAPLSA